MYRFGGEGALQPCGNKRKLVSETHTRVYTEKRKRKGETV